MTLITCISVFSPHNLEQDDRYENYERSCYKLGMQMPFYVALFRPGMNL